jgi:hypothetical protein
MNRLVTMLALGTAVAFVGSAASAQIGIPAKLKAGKVQGNLVPAYYPSDTGPGTGDDEDDSPAFQDTGVQSSACTFTQGKFKAQVGKDAAVALKGVTCGGMAFSGTLCAHTKILATIMSEDIDKTGATTGVMCNSTAGDIAGKQNFVTGNIGHLTCTAGSCKGTLPVVTADPCPSVDKVAEIRRLEVFDGPDEGSATILGTTLAVCCGPHQTLVGGAAPSGAPCNTSTQHVLAEMGTVTQGQ